MRVTANMFPDSLVRQLNRLNARQSRLQVEAATGQRIQFPEDNPSAMRRVLDLQAESQTLAQYRTNISRLTDQTAATYSSVRAVRNVSDRAGEIATLADGTRSPQELNIYATEVSQLIQQAVQLMNSQSQGDYLFSGTKSDTPPFALTLDANGNVASVTYQGNTSVTAAEIAANVKLSVQALGANTTGTGSRGVITDSRAGADFFQHLINLQNNLLAGDTTAIADTTRGQLAADEQNLITHIARLGSLTARLEAGAAVALDRTTSLEKLISREADADLSETLVRLSETQTAYKAALQSGATILNLSLLDYLR